MNIGDVLFRGNTLGNKEVGIEIEVEGERLPVVLDELWRTEHDGSLRNEAYEYVLNEPVPRNKVKISLLKLKKRLILKKSEIQDSGRAGVHIHVNIRDLTRSELYNFICLYLIFEDVLVDYCGKDRVGNLFCLRTKDAEYITDLLMSSARNRELRELHTDNIRYASINCKAICQYGSLEFRAMRSTLDLTVLNNWVEMLLCLKDAAKLYDDPQSVVSCMSAYGGRAFAEHIFGNKLSCFPTVDWEASVKEGIRRAQPLAYCSNWKERKGNGLGLKRTRGVVPVFEIGDF